MKRAVLRMVGGAFLCGAALQNVACGKDEGAAPNPFFAMDTCSPKGQLELLKELGYAGFSWVPSADMQAELAGARGRGLKIFAVYTGSWLRAGTFEGDQSAVIASLRDSGAAVWLTLRSEAFKNSDEAGDRLAVPALQAMADQAASNSVRIALYPHTGFWLERVQDAVRLAKKVNRPNFGVTFNLCHALMVGDEAKLSELLAEARPHLFFVTLNGADAGAGGTEWKRLIRPLDEGSLDLSPLLKQLSALGYAGPVGLQGYGVAAPPKENLTRSWRAWQKYSQRPQPEKPPAAVRGTAALAPLAGG